MAQIGDRVAAICHADKETVYLFGYGTYMGNEVPPADVSPTLNKFGIENPKIQLDSGEVVWGFQCWWGDEAQAKESFGDRKIINSPVNE